MEREDNLTQKDSWFKKEGLKRELLSKTFEEKTKTIISSYFFRNTSVVNRILDLI